MNIWRILFFATICNITQSFKFFNKIRRPFLLANKASDDALFSQDPDRTPLMVSKQPSDSYAHFKNDGKALIEISNRIGLSLIPLNPLRKCTFCVGSEEGPVPYGKLILRTEQKNGGLDFSITVDDIIDYLKCGACVLLVTVDRVSGEYTFSYFLSPANLTDFEKAIKMNAIKGSATFYPYPSGVARRGLALIMEGYKYNMKRDQTRFANEVRSFTTSPKCRKETSAFLNTDDSMMGRKEVATITRKEENFKGALNAFVQQRKSVTAFFELIGGPMKSLAGWSKFGFIFTTDDNTPAPFGKLLSGTPTKIGQVVFKMNVRQILSLLADGGCLVFVILNGETGVCDYVYFVPPTSRPELERSIEEYGLMNLTAFTCRPYASSKNRSLASVMKPFKFNFNDAKLKEKVTEFYSGVKTRQETAVFLESHHSMIADKALQTKQAFLTSLQELFPGVKLTSLESNRLDATLSDGATTTIFGRKANKGRSGYQVHLRSVAGTVIDANEVSALAVGIPLSRSEDKQDPGSREPHTIVLLATRTTDGRLALGGSDIGRQNLYFNWKADQEIFDISSNVYNRSPGNQKDWVVVTFPEKDDPENEAKMVAVRLLIEEILTAFASRSLLTAAEEQRCKEAFDLEKEVATQKDRNRRFESKRRAE